MTRKSLLFGARHGLLLVPIAIALVWFALSPVARAVSPAPDGGYPGHNTAEGEDALKSLSTGGGNTAVGFQALFHNTRGAANTATGLDALFSNTTGAANTATGSLALLNNTTGDNNTATGRAALQKNTTGSDNTATGLLALQQNTTGGGNTATGFFALQSNATGSGNIALGFRAGLFITGSNNVDIGNEGVAGDSNHIRIGTERTHTAAFIAGILGATVPSGVEVIVGTNGQLGTMRSSERFKEAIKPMGKASGPILALKPVTFRYKRKLDPEGIPQFGLVAEQVEKINPDLVARDHQGKVITVRYEAVNAMLLNEFLKEHRKVQEPEAAIAQQQKEIRALSASLRLPTAQIRTVRAASSR